MRLRELRLVRYGKFTDATLAFPRAAHDFHLVVGPNEAGKSTLRDAVTELLFGLPRSSPKAFLHPMADLRLGAVVEDGADVALTFDRTKSTKAPLRTPDDAPLPDDALAPFLGGADRAFFVQMFGLDHTQLVRGGQGILDAADDVGQMLFQSAAGIAGLGRVKEALAEEASRLWAPRKAQDRAFYIAQQHLDEATAALKAATVRTRVWADARAALDEARERVQEQARIHDDLARRRTRLERIRRLAPVVRRLRDAEAALATLGAVPPLPADAAPQLERAAAERARAESLAAARVEDLQRAEAAWRAVAVDDAVLAAAGEIDALVAGRHRIEGHAAELQRLTQERDRLASSVREACDELGWPHDDAAVRAALPTRAALQAVARLIASRGAAVAAVETAEAALETRRREQSALLAALHEPAPDAAAPVLRAALAEARAARAADARDGERAHAREAARRRLAMARAGLAPWQGDLAALVALPVPSVTRVAAAVQQHQRLAAELDAARRQADDAARLAEEARLAVDRFAGERRVVTDEAVAEARDRRDALWRSLRGGGVPSDAAAAGLEAAIALADRLADDRLASAADGATLQALRQQLVQQAARARLAAAQRDERAAALQAVEAAWSAESAAAGLAAVPLADLPDWLARRDAALQAAEAVQAEDTWTARAAARATAAAQRLATALADAAPAVDAPAPGPAVPVDDLAALCEAAEAHLRAAEAAATRRALLQEQLAAARHAVDAADVDLQQARRALERWEADWAASREAARIAGSGASSADAEAAVERVRRIADALDRADALARDTLEPMRAALDGIVSSARALQARLAPADAAAVDAPPATTTTGDAATDEADATRIARQLADRLREARTAHQAREAAAQALRAAHDRRAAADDAVRAADAAVGHLLMLAGVTTLGDARPLAEQADRHRRLLAQADEARAQLVAGGDGLALDALLAEADGSDGDALVADLAATERALAESTDALTRLAEQRLRAQQAVDAIAGQADAALAEARRQEALAEMAEASERYLKVATASRLLRWAVDRYRERRQGPMLARASTLFRGLTLGRFERLAVDHDAEPVRLAAVRAGGAPVGVEGLSEGTRDQLYLALRLAALELHLDHAVALPFVADDLFVNFDDARSRAGLAALRDLSTRTQVLFLTHHEHLVPVVRGVFGDDVPVVRLQP